MFCKRWRPHELLPRAELLCYFLKQNECITGVALTGSLARLEPKIHDIDLVVFHNGQLEDGCCQDPTREGSFYYTDTVRLEQCLASGISIRHLNQARMGVSVNYTFVSEKVLWDCGYLRSLEAMENFPDFFLRVFCDIPLVLLDPSHLCGAFRERFPACKFLTLEQVDGYFYFGINIHHQCSGSKLCRPRQSWNECRKEIKRRKGHWWHG